VSNVRAHDYNFEEEIDLLFFECSIRRRFSRKRDKKYAKEKKEKNKTEETFLETKTRPMMLRRRQSHPLLFLFWCFFLLLVSFPFLPSSSNAQEEEGKCPLDIAKIDLSGLGNACGNADDPGTFFISLFLYV
jgi:hypothetical protein